MKRYSVVLIVVLILVFVFYYISTDLSFIDEEKEQHYTLLIIPKSTGNTKPKPKEQKNIHLLFYWYPKPYFLLFSIPTNLYLEENGTFGKLDSSSAFQIKRKLESTYGFSVDFVANFDEKDFNNLLELSGGTTYFNLYSNSMRKGEVYLEKKNYAKFLDGIEDLFRREDAKKGVWLTLLENYRQKNILEEAYKNNLNLLFKHLGLDMNFGTYKKLLSPILQKTSTDELYVKAIRANLTKIKNEKYGEIDIPYQNGKYDSRIIREILSDYKNDSPKAELFPIVMQLRNTTDVSRLAVRTAGVLRLRKIDVLEYLNSPTKLERSVILNYAHSPLKTRYVKRHTKVGTSYKMFDYRENFDFTLYLSEDYYGIKLLRD